MKPIAICCHVSASSFGDRALIDQWHKQRGFAGIGYHRLVLNGFRSKYDAYASKLDGYVNLGRPDKEQGAHCLAGGMNAISLGVCVIGNPGWVPDWREGDEPWPEFLKAGPKDRYLKRVYMTVKQHEAHVQTLATLCDRHGIDPLGKVRRPDGKLVYALSQHSDHDPLKPLCSSLNMAVVRAQVAARLK
jgi:hypothetical protein